MPNQRDIDRRNDVRFLTPLLLMALVLVIAFWLMPIPGMPRPQSGRRRALANRAH